MSENIYKCGKRVRFALPDSITKVVWEMNPGFIGTVPDWVEKDWYFQALCKDGSITAIKSHKDRDIQKAEVEKENEETPAGGEEENAPKGKKNSGGKK